MNWRSQYGYRIGMCACVVLLSACASTGGGGAPVIERAVSQPKAVKVAKPAKTVNALSSNENKSSTDERDPRPQFYTVQRGDTLYSIAFNHGLDYREVAELNKIQDPNMIQVGQELRLLQPNTAAAPQAQIESKPLVQTPLLETPLLETPLLEQPKAYKLPYTEQALAEIQKLQEAPRKAETQISKSEATKPEPIKPEPEIEPKSAEAIAEAVTENDEAVNWGLPTQGKVLSGFSESANRKGIDVAGTKGQAVLASASGKVVYSGSGLRGYGKLVIIKHNKTYLSAYAHNDQILVKEGQVVGKGQKIAEMGDTDADRVKLHFEIRKFGKPVDPAKYLPPL